MIHNETTGSAGGQFPITRYSALVALRSDQPEVRRRAFDRIVAAYWRPVYKYIRIRRRRSSDDAQDLTQGFFTRVVEKGFFDNFDPAKARFRTFLRTCLERYLNNESRAESAQKRGSGDTVLSLDFASVEGEIAPIAAIDETNPEVYFEREWVRGLLESAIGQLKERLENSGRARYYQLFMRYDVEGFESGERITYSDLAAEFQVSPTDVTNYLAAARREFRAIVLEIIRDLTVSDDEYRREVRVVLGVEVD